MFPVMPIHRCVHGCIVCEVCMCVCRRKAWACVCAAAPLPPGWVLCALAGMALTPVGAVRPADTNAVLRAVCMLPPAAVADTRVDARVVAAEPE